MPQEKEVGIHLRKKNIGKEHRPLPACLLKKSEWNSIIRILEKEADNPKVWKKVQPIIQKAAASRFPDKKVCMVCGATEATGTGLCRACSRLLHEHGELRCIGHAKGYPYGNNGKCEACGRDTIESCGLCRNCYCIKRKKGFKTNAEVRKYKLQQHSRVTPVLNITKEEAILYGYPYIKEDKISDSSDFDGTGAASGTEQQK